MRTAATLLSSSRSIRGLTDTLSATGIAGSPVPIDAATRAALGIEALQCAELAAGPGSLRVLLAQFANGALIREELQRAARRLSSRAPHVLWLIAAVDSNGTTAAIVGWSNGAQPRVASFLWETDRVVDSDAETLCALASVRGDADVLLHARCIEVLGRDALTRRFYRALEAQVSALAAALPATDRQDGRDVALLYASRLLFLSFLEAKGWLDSDRAFLANRFDECMRTGGNFHRRVLLPLFFGTLNTPSSRRARLATSFGRIPFLNGGLFTRTPLERRAGRGPFPDDRFGLLFEQLFHRFRFVAREDSATWSEASVDPEMLGRAFESLMASAERRAGGVYYTPHALVSRVSEHALAAALEGRGTNRGALSELRVLDPACGSGAFLVYVLERLADLRREHGDVRATAEVRRDVLAKCVFGVDRSATAVWLCQLRLWLSVVIESDDPDPHSVRPLPNLDRNIRVGDTLAGAAFSRGQLAVVGGARILQLRDRYIRASGPRKQFLARALDREERRRALAQMQREIEVLRHQRGELLAAQRARDLFGQRLVTSPEVKRQLKHLRDTLRSARREHRRVVDGGALSFSFAACFADVQAAGGFHIVLGNPPWVRLHRIPAALRLQFKQAYDVYRSAHWQHGALGARASVGFASQVDLAALFVERSVALSRAEGIVSLLLPVKLWRSLAGGGVRRFLAERTTIVRLEDLSESKHAFDAAVYPSLLVVRAAASPNERIVTVHHGRDAQREWNVGIRELAFDESPGAPWLTLAPEARAAFDRLRAAGVALASSPIGSPRLGVKSGCNAAFVVRLVDTSRDLAIVADADGEQGKVELSMLRPALRGDSVELWDRRRAHEWIVWTHDERGAPLAHLPQHARLWLRRRYTDLCARSDGAHARRWWSLFRVDAGNSSQSRVVWADFGKRPRALVLPSGDPTVPLNTCYVVPCADECDAWALTTLLNSALIASWLNALAEPARGGYHRYLGWTVGQLPLPKDWMRARAILSAAARKNDDEILEAVLAAYRLERSDVRALLEMRS